MVPRPPEVKARHAYYGPRHKAGFNPVAQDEMYIYLVQNVQGNPRLEPERWPAVMQALLADFGAHIARPRRALGDAAHTAPPQLASGATIAIEDAIVLSEILLERGKLDDFTARRFKRCRLVVENSRQLGEWEKSPEAPGADPTALISPSMKALAAPI